MMKMKKEDSTMDFVCFFVSQDLNLTQKIKLTNLYEILETLTHWVYPRSGEDGTTHIFPGSSSNNQLCI